MIKEDIAANYISRLTQSPPLTQEEEIALAEAFQKGCSKARERLIQSNMRLVINIAKSYRNHAIPLEDLVQEGAIGLMHAIERFDPRKGFRFSTYATHWIRQAIGRAIDNKAKAIRVPSHILQSLRKIEKARLEYVREKGYEPSMDQMATILGISSKKLSLLMNSCQELLSLDAYVGDQEDTSLAHILKSEHLGDPESELFISETAKELQHILMELNDRERRIMSYRLKVSPLDDNKVRSDLAKELQLSRERVRQIEVQAIKKLRVVAQQKKFLELLAS